MPLPLLTVVQPDAQRQFMIACGVPSDSARGQQGGQSQRAAVAAAGVARGTLRHWRAPKVLSAPPALAAFAETPEGVRWLRQMLVAAHGCITELGGGGIRVVDEFIELSGLSAFIGASYGTQQWTKA